MRPSILARIIDSIIWESSRFSRKRPISQRSLVANRVGDSSKVSRSISISLLVPRGVAIPCGALHVMGSIAQNFRCQSSDYKRIDVFFVDSSCEKYFNVWSFNRMFSLTLPFNDAVNCLFYRQCSDSQEVWILAEVCPSHEQGGAFSHRRIS